MIELWFEDAVGNRSKMREMPEAFCDMALLIACDADWQKLSADVEKEPLRRYITIERIL